METYRKSKRTTMIHQPRNKRHPRYKKVDWSYPEMCVLLRLNWMREDGRIKNWMTYRFRRGSDANKAPETDDGDEGNKDAVRAL
jgi:hypothetical protein